MPVSGNVDWLDALRRDSLPGEREGEEPPRPSRRVRTRPVIATSRWLFLAAAFLAFYKTGAGFIESFVNYPTWRLIGAAEFATYHTALDSLVIRYLAVPALAGYLTTIGLIWVRPAQVPRAAVMAAVASQTVAVVATVTFFLPLQFKLSAEGLSIPLLDQLIVANFWLRRVPGLVNAALFLWMLARATAPATAPSSRECA